MIAGRRDPLGRWVDGKTQISSLFRAAIDSVLSMASPLGGFRGTNITPLWHGVRIPGACSLPTEGMGFDVPRSTTK